MELNRLLQKLNIPQFRRHLTAQAAAAALRPFYRLVHPDLHAVNPDVRQKNENSLKIFNGYLNEIFQNNRHKPVKVNFFIRKGDGFEDVHLDLSGSDPYRIVKMALERCRLETDHIQKRTVQPMPKTSHLPTPPDIPAAWMNYGKVLNKRKSTFDLYLDLEKKRKLATERRAAFELTAEMIQDEVEFVQRKTGAKKIIWAMSWDQTYMRRCLINVLQMLKQVDSESREHIIHALNGRHLVFGRGTFICCDGSVQFGADDVSETWEKVCRESSTRRYEIDNLRHLIDRIRTLLGGATIIISDKSNLLQTVWSLQALIVRISSKDQKSREELCESATGLVFEIGDSYSGITILSRGYIIVPCNIEISHLTSFLKENRGSSLKLLEDFKKEKIKIDAYKDECVRELNLKELSFDVHAAPQALINTFTRLKQLRDDRIRDALRGTHLHLSLGLRGLPSVLTDGRLSIPMDCNFFD